MIFVNFDTSILPEALKQKAIAAQNLLATLPVQERNKFINEHSREWKAFKPYLAKMSHRKCWYSESPEAHSRKDVDHFRPKNQAKRSCRDDVDDGYPWLAFDWTNFRYAAINANQLNTDEDSGEVVGKGSWFPLALGSKKATWDDRCIAQEKYILLDPTHSHDVDLIDVDPVSGKMKPSWICLSPNDKNRVKKSVELYGLDSGDLVAARMRLIRDLTEDCENLLEVLTHEHSYTMDAKMRLINKLRRATTSTEPYSRTARAVLRSQGFGELCSGPEHR